MISHSPVSYFADGRALDLAIYSDPVAGAGALKDVVILYGKNGSIRNNCVVNELKHNLEMVAWHLQRGHIQAARIGLRTFKLTVNIMNRLRIVSPWAKGKLIYLTDGLLDAIQNHYAKELVADLNGNLPAEFELSQNYPNPFNPQTEIAYALPQNSDVRLSIYDILGQEIKVLVQGQENAGAKTVIWDGTNATGDKVSSGTYFYRLQAGDFNQTKKMSLMK
jgi:hypothetical protein